MEPWNVAEKPSSNTQLIVPLDVDTLDEARQIVRKIGPAVQWYKVGKQLFTRFGPDSVRFVKDQGKNVFLDLKFHDIPNTVAHAVGSAAALGADMTNVHASGGPAMLKTAAEAAAGDHMILIAVTVLTSLNTEDLRAVGVPCQPEEQVVRLARLAAESGIAGVVCSALEIAPVREACGLEFVLVVPGIRPAGSSHGDQRRVMTPSQASEAGADYVVVGRPITRADDPEAAAAAVLAELAGA